MSESFVWPAITFEVRHRQDGSKIDRQTPWFVAFVTDGNVWSTSSYYKTKAEAVTNFRRLRRDYKVGSSLFRQVNRMIVEAVVPPKYRRGL